MLDQRNIDVKNVTVKCLMKTILIHHNRICGYFVEQKSHQCKICEKMFYSNNELSLLLIKCGKFICYECSVPFLSPNALNYHIEICHRQGAINKQYRCSICKF